MTVFNHAGSADVVIDVEGYYRPLRAARCTTRSPPFVLLAPWPPVRQSPPPESGCDSYRHDDRCSLERDRSGREPDSSRCDSCELLDGSPRWCDPAHGVEPQLRGSEGRPGNRQPGDSRNRHGWPIEIFNHAGTVNVDFDVDGYYGPTGSYFVPITPVRVADTRVSMDGSAIAAGTSEAFNLATVAAVSPLPPRPLRPTTRSSLVPQMAS